MEQKLEKYKKTLEGYRYKNLHTLAGYNKKNTRKLTTHEANAQLRAAYNQKIAEQNSERFLMRQNLEDKRKKYFQVADYLKDSSKKRLTIKNQLNIYNKYEELREKYLKLSTDQLHTELKKDKNSEYWNGFLKYMKGGFTRKRRGRSLKASQR